jgi:hypothetical protein
LFAQLIHVPYLWGVDLKFKRDMKTKKKTPTYKELYETVYRYSTKHKLGFTGDELREVLVKYPDMDKSRVEGALYGNTCTTIDGDIIHSHCDLLNALVAGHGGVYMWD